MHVDNFIVSARWVLVLGVWGAAAACSTSIAIRKDDPAFSRAQDRLGRTKVVVSQTNAAEDEQLRFIQAEGFYRYRFAFPRRSLGTHLAQAAAVALELPALQALAGSLDVMELRLRSYDGAVQLWEALLIDHPRTTLRPLTLYRLGWAYRSAAVAGLPRESGDQALDQLIREYPESEFSILANAAKVVPWKSKDTATGLTIIPGLGQMYVGEHLNGSVRLAVALAAAVMIVVPFIVGYQRRDDLAWKRDWPLLGTAIGGFVILSVDYTTAYQDAMRGVVQFNERAEQEFEDHHPNAP